MLPEMSFRVTTGTVAIPALLTAPVAAVVSTISVAIPAETVTVTWFEVIAGDVMEAVTYLSPVAPLNLRASKVTRPPEATRSRVPVKAPPVRVTSGFSRVTKFWSWSRIRTTTSEMTWLFLAEVSIASSKEVATPWPSSTV